MNMPGFTAEASLQRTRARYHTATGFHGGDSGHLSLQAISGLRGPRSAAVPACATECANTCNRRCALEPTRWCGVHRDQCFRECIDINCCEAGCEPCRLTDGRCQHLCHDDHCQQRMEPCTCPNGEVCTARGCCARSESAAATTTTAAVSGRRSRRNQACCQPCGSDCCARGIPCINGQCCPKDRVCAAIPAVSHWPRAPAKVAVRSTSIVAMMSAATNSVNAVWGEVSVVHRKRRPGTCVATSLVMDVSCGTVRLGKKSFAVSGATELAVRKKKSVVAATAQVLTVGGTLSAARSSAPAATTVVASSVKRVVRMGAALPIRSVARTEVAVPANTACCFGGGCCPTSSGWSCGQTPGTCVQHG